ncbi:MAG TPA: antibiotic biosynthesis monooxygenase [Chitinophagaceae bacterium]|nr:antibiotic biosynthesis monooxygenase [Chitinophagaceae bacterium]
MIPTVALWVQLEAKKGKEAEVEKFLRDGLSVVNREPGTVTWYALKLGPTSYGIFDSFSDAKGREGHLTGEIAKALNERSSELFSKPPTIERIDILAAKMPELEHH